MTQVAVLPLSEDVSVDQDELARLYIKMDCAADEMVARSIEELAYRLAHGDRLFRQADTEKMRQCALSIGTIAGQLGMGMLARTAADVAACCASGDAVALAATHSRMIRLGEGSLREIWELQELPL